MFSWLVNEGKKAIARQAIAYLEEINQAVNRGGGGGSRATASTMFKSEIKSRGIGKSSITLSVAIAQTEGEKCPGF